MCSVRREPWHDKTKKRRLKSAWASRLRCNSEEWFGHYLPTEPTNKTMIRLGPCPGWYEYSLCAPSDGGFAMLRLNYVTLMKSLKVMPIISVAIIVITWAAACDFQQCGILTSVDSDQPAQPPFRRRNSKWCSVSSLTVIEYSSDLQRLWSDCAYAQADLRFCWSHIPHC